MIEVLKQAIDYIDNVPDDRDNVGHIDRRALALSINQAIAELESQEPVAWMSTYKNDSASDKFRFMQSDMYPTPVFTHPPQRTEQNFCPRCGKRTNDIHTCTPPRDIT